MHNTSVNPTAQTYAELQQVFTVFNRELFADQLPPCLLTLQREKRTYGYFSLGRFGSRAGQTTDEIALNPEYFAVVPVVEILQTVAHEMVHLWQAHFGRPGRARYHNEEWADKMEAIGLMPSSTGQPGGRRVGDRMADYVLPGGRFSAVVSDLVQGEGFGITWYDRFPPAGPLYPVDGAGACAGLPAAALVVAAQQGVAVATPTSAAPGAAGQHAPAANRSNRVKYSCPQCGLNAWAKPAARLACLECQLELQALLDVDQGAYERSVSRSALPRHCGRGTAVGSTINPARSTP